jgi:hypothetical protein
VHVSKDSNSKTKTSSSDKAERNRAPLLPLNDREKEKSNCKPHYLGFYSYIVPIPFFASVTHSINKRENRRRRRRKRSQEKIKE